MSKLTVQEFVTIDGFAAAPDGALDFMPSGGRTPADPQIERDQLRFIKDELVTMLLGCTKYQIFIDYWPTATTDNAIIADELNALSKIVASRTLDHAPGVTEETRRPLFAMAWRRLPHSGDGRVRE